MIYFLHRPPGRSATRSEVKVIADGRRHRFFYNQAYLDQELRPFFGPPDSCPLLELIGDEPPFVGEPETRKALAECCEAQRAWLQSKTAQTVDRVARAAGGRTANEFVAGRIRELNVAASRLGCPERDDRRPLTLNQLSAWAGPQQPAPPQVEPPAAAAQAEQVSDEPADDDSKEDRALMFLVAHPGWSNVRIAKEVGCSRTSLNRMPRFMKARAALKATKQEAPKGRKSPDGSVEAWDGDRWP